MTGLDVIAPPKTVTVTFSLEPAYNVGASLAWLDMAESFTGLGEWVYQTVEALSAERLRTNQIVLLDTSVYLAGADWPSFPAWVDDLAARDATTLRDQALQAQIENARRILDGIPEPSELLADHAAYLAFVEELYRRREQEVDLSLWEEVHRLLNDPPARQDLIVTHLRTMWDEVLAPEWERNLPLLEESIAAFQSLDWTGLTVAQVLDRVILREIPSASEFRWLAEAENIILIPSAHNGPYLLRMGSGRYGATERLVFGARIPEGSRVSSPTLSRSELLMRLNALANDTRLRIIALLAKNAELNAADVVAQLKLSQSAASRHLEHLTATGYLIVRHEGAKRYRLNPERIDHTFKALKALCQ